MSHPITEVESRDLEKANGKVGISDVSDRKNINNEFATALANSHYDKWSRDSWTLYCEFVPRA